jgi:hypothetical protein
MTSYDALRRMAADHRAQLLAEADLRRLAGRRPASRRTRAAATWHRPLSHPDIATACR